MDVNYELRELFKGRERAYGIYNVDPAITESKKTGFAVTKLLDEKENWENLWDMHLEGKQGLGVIPIRDDNECYFAASDIDVYPIDLPGIAKQLDDAQLPMIPCRTKSGGAHLYLFFTDPCPASDVIDKMNEINSALGFPGVEIFPKQRKVEKRTPGNWINMPYFDLSNVTRVGIKADGTEMTVEEFIETGNSKRVSPDAFMALHLPARELPLPGCPPCMESLIARGSIPEGSRNNMLYNFGVYAKMADPENWEPRLVELNYDYMDPPLDARNVTTVTRSLARHDPFYKCNDQPICNVCDKKECRKREFGIGPADGGGGVEVEMGQLMKYQVFQGEKPTNDEPYWSMDIDQIPVTMATDQLMHQAKFRRRVLEACNKLPQKLPADIWEQVLQNRTEHMEIVELPFESGQTGQFIDLLRQFLTVFYTTEKSELAMGRAYDNGNGRMTFRARELQQFIRANGLRLAQGRFFEIMHSLDVVDERVSVGRYQQIPCWSIKKFDDFVDPDLVVKDVDTEF